MCAAVSNHGGGQWMVEQCTFRQINSAGLECTTRPYEYADSRVVPEERRKTGQGEAIIRHNHSPIVARQEFAV